MGKRKNTSKVKNNVEEKEIINFVQMINTDNDVMEPNSVNTTASTENNVITKVNNENITIDTLFESNTYSKDNPYGGIDSENVAQKTNINGGMLYNRRFENMPLTLLLKYKEAILSLNKDYTYLVEINKDYDRITYYDALSKSKKMLNYLEKVNEVIENKILEIKID